jgi:hypothetical protein
VAVQLASANSCVEMPSNPARYESAVAPLPENGPHESTGKTGARKNLPKFIPGELHRARK